MRHIKNGGQKDVTGLERNWRTTVSFNLQVSSRVQVLFELFKFGKDIIKL